MTDFDGLEGLVSLKSRNIHSIEIGSAQAILDDVSSLVQKRQTSGMVLGRGYRIIMRTSSSGLTVEFEAHPLDA